VSIETVKVNLVGKEQISRITKYTGLQYRNVVCRWAFVHSLSELSSPAPISNKGEPGIEIDWRTFGGRYRDVYMALLKQRCKQDGLEITDDVLQEQFWLHLHRGLSYLAVDRDIRTIYVSGGVSAIEGQPRLRSAIGLLSLTRQLSPSVA
jgi:DNA sulfur modification protein DndE